MDMIESLRLFLFYAFWVLFALGFIVGIYLYNPKWKSYFIALIVYLLFAYSVGYFRENNPNIIEYVRHIYNTLGTNTPNPRGVFGGAAVAGFLGHCAGNFALDISRLYLRFFSKKI